MAAELQRQLCANHPERFGHALCMTCRKTVCQECATEWEGINYCVSCLKRRRQSSKARPSLIGWALVGTAAVALFYAACKAMVWGAALLVDPWS